MGAAWRPGGSPLVQENQALRREVDTFDERVAALQGDLDRVFEHARVPRFQNAPCAVGCFVIALFFGGNHFFRDASAQVFPSGLASGCAGVSETASHRGPNACLRGRFHRVARWTRRPGLELRRFWRRKASYRIASKRSAKL